MPVLKCLVSMACVVLTVGPLFADQKSEAWEQFVPPPDNEFDWVQLDSGEWLKGELKVMYDYTLEFDSDELDLLELDIDDVRRIRTKGTQRVLVETGRRTADVFRGRVLMDRESVKLISRESTNAFTRSQLISIAGGAKRERDNWSGSFSVGATLRGGNTETADVTTQSNLRRRTAISRFNVDYIGIYSTARKVETANNHRVNGFYDWFLTTRFYWKLLEAEYYRDPFVNIKNQYSVSSGVGYDLIRSSRTEWTIGAGGGYQDTQFDSVVPPAKDSSDSGFGTVNTRFDYDITGDIDFLYDYSARFLNEESGRYTHHMVTSLSVDLIGDLDLDVSLIWDRIAKPQSSDDGAGGTVTPEQDDYQLIVGVAYDF